MGLNRIILLCTSLFVFVACTNENNESITSSGSDVPDSCVFRSSNFYDVENPLTGQRIPLILNDDQQEYVPDSVYVLKRRMNLDSGRIYSTDLAVREIRNQSLPVEFTGVEMNDSSFVPFSALADTFYLTDKPLDTIPFSLDSVEKIVYESGEVMELPKLKRFDNAYFNVKSLFQDHGLPGNDVYGVNPVDNGNYWISTGEGLACVKGNFIQTFKGLPGSVITSSIQDAQGHLWMSIYEGGIVKYDGIHMYHFDRSYFEGDNRMHDLFEDNEGKIWVSRSGGASLITENQIINFNDDKKLIRELRSITKDKEGNIWFASVVNGVSCFDGEKILNWNTSIEFIYDDIFDIVSRGDEVWIGTHGAGIVKYKGGQFSKYDKGLSNRTLTALFVDRENRIWMGTDGGGAYYIEDEKLFNLSTRSGLSDDIVLDIDQDESGNILMGTYGGGVNILSKPEIKNYYKENGLPTNKVSAVYRDRSDKLWIGSWGVGFGYIRNGQLKWFQDDANKSGYVLSFEEDHEGNLWIGTYSEGTIKFDGHQFYHYAPENNSSHEIILEIERKEESLWFGANNGLYLKEGERFITYDNLKNVFLDKPISDIYIGKNGTTFLASEGYGLKIINNDTVRAITEYNGLPSNDVLSIERDDAGNLWIGTRKGLVLLKDSVFYHFHEELGLRSDVINDIKILSPNDIWVTTSNGLSNIRMSNGIYIIRNYDTDDGLKNDDFFASKIEYIESGHGFWLGSNKGLISFDLPDTTRNSETSVVIRQVEVNGEVMNYNPNLKGEDHSSVGEKYEPFNHTPRSLSLTYDRNNLIFRYSVNGDFKERQFQFRLLGLNDEWSQPTMENKVDFKSLPAGKYTFQVKPYGDDEVVSDELAFTIKPPFWLSWYAKTIYILVGLLFILFVIRIRTYRLRKHQKFLEQEIRLATSEIRNQKQEVEKQRDFAEDQKAIVQRKNEEILDSINYSKRLQDAILPSIASIKEEFEDAFVLFKPKDIVSGDFYWMEKYEGLTMLAVADCTGHGVPGAMVSVVCANALNKVVLEMGKKDPAEILNETRKLVIETFSKSSEDVKDGMDISLCVFNEDKSELKWAGANNPLWIIRKEKEEVEMIKADKQPIGKYGLAKPFTTHKVEVGKNDRIYMFSDGYVDQFGGPKGKKLKSSKFKQLLLSKSTESMNGQKMNLDNALSSWKGSLEQIDDICIVGVLVRS